LIRSWFLYTGVKTQLLKKNLTVKLWFFTISIFAGKTTNSYYIKIIQIYSICSSSSSLIATCLCYNGETSYLSDAIEVSISDHLITVCTRKTIKEHKGKKYHGSYKITEVLFEKKSSKKILNQIDWSELHAEMLTTQF